jgi:carboxypeptidase family protein/TonB-dependent receptor-like protein
MSIALRIRSVLASRLPLATNHSPLTTGSLRHRLCLSLFLFASVVTVHLSTATFSWGQTGTATLSGVIQDPKGGIVPDTEVTITRIETGAVATTETNGAGVYVFTGLMPGHFHLLVQKPGFKEIAIKDIELHTQDKLEQNFSLEIGSVSETITVVAGGLNINTTDASVSTVVDHTYVENMPLNGRSFQDLILLTPGIVTASPQNPAGQAGNGVTGEFSVNGQRTESNYYTVDGVSANVGASPGAAMIEGAGASGSVAAATTLGTTQALVSVDDLQEFRVNSSTYSAEYGRNPGGQFAFETKSGTNQWHGAGYDYLRNDFFDANDYFNDYLRPLDPALTKPALRQNDFGGTFGGPVRIPHLYDGKDKTFFFVSYEGLRLTQPQAATSIFVPDETLRANAPAPLNQVLNAFPVPSANGIDDTANGIGQFIGSWSNPASINSTSVRFDHLINDKLRFFFRFSDTTSNSSVRGNASYTPPTMNLISAYSLQTYTAGVSSELTNEISNEFRLNYSSNEITNQYVMDPFGGSTPVDIRQLAGLGPYSEPLVAFYIAQYNIALYVSKSSGAQKQWNVTDAVTLSKGRHQLKFGIDYRRLAPFAIPSNPEVQYFYFSSSAVEANGGDAISILFAPAHPLYTNFSAFAQDEWRVSARLSLSLGLRWEVNPAPGVTQGLKPYTVEGSSPDTWVLAPQGTPLWQTTWGNFAPRLGAAYVVRNAPGRETVVRGGGGVFFDTGQQLGSQGFVGPGFLSISDFLPASFPSYPIAPPIVNPPTSPYNTQPYVFSPHLQLPYTLQWNASIEQALGKSQTLTASYVGSHAARLLQQNVFSPPNNPNYPTFGVVQNGLTADYDALQIQFRRMLSRGLTALASYTYSHCIDYGSENYNLAYERGNCDFDVRHSFSGAFSYDLPNVGHAGWESAVLHHWGFDDRFTARTAFPVTLNGNQLLQPNGQVYYGGLNFVPGEPVYLYGANCASVLQGLGDLESGQGCPGGRAINPNAFMSANSGLGDAPRNFARGFDAVQMDLAVRREFPIHEALKLQFRAEAFNIFNHPNFGAINSNFGQPTFGQATATLANSLGVLSPLYQMGGPRSMQFALKLVF